MMRRAFAFLSILIFIVSMAPCSDCETVKPSVEQEISSQTPVKDAHADDTEECSPFCCSCCNFTISQKAFDIDLTNAVNSSYYPAILISEPVKHARKIWQPPRA